MFNPDNSISITAVSNGFLVFCPVKVQEPKQVFGMPEEQYVGLFDKILKRKDPILSQVEDNREKEEDEANRLLQSAMPAITPETSITFFSTID